MSGPFFFMIISKIQFKNFRNLNLTFEPDASFNLILGENGAGKSNLLDAFYHLALGKTFKPYALKCNINFKSNAQFAVIDSEVNEAGKTTELKIIFANQEGAERKRFEVNGKATTRARFTQHLDVILFAPHNINLLIGSPDLRRAELDDFASLCDYKYAAYINEYQTVIRNRNRLLKCISEGTARVDQLPYWDNKMVNLGSYLVASRLHIFSVLQPLVSKLANEHFQGELDGVQLNYLSKFTRSDLDISQPFASLESDVRQTYERLLATGRDKELNSRQSQYGPHKDDFEMLHQGNDLKIFGSRGQQRIATFLLKFAMWQYLAELKQRKPLILLDDIMSELDERNRRLLENMITEIDTQTFITTTHASDYSEKFRHKPKVLQLT